MKTIISFILLAGWLVVAAGPCSVFASEVVDLRLGQEGPSVVLDYTLKADGSEKDGNVSLTVSLDGGRTWFTPKTVTGDLGRKVKVGPGKRITWNVLADYPKGIDAADVRYRVEAAGDGGAGPSGPSFTNSIGQKFVLIPAGSFMMGSPTSEPKRDDDERQHRVTISKPFYMQTTEVTQGQWQAVMGSNPSHFSSCGDDCPVEQVSWNDAQEFIRRLNAKEGTNQYRLPTEAEWEYACRAGTTTPFAFGSCLSTNQANYDGNYPLPGCNKGAYRGSTVSAGSFAPNSWGLHDMHGNVWEWCRDRYGDYPSGSVTDPAGPSSGSFRVNRGGSWFFNARDCRSAYRSRSDPGGRSFDLGFRLARTK